MNRLRLFLTVPNLARLLLLGLLIYSLYDLETSKPPWKTTWEKHKAEGLAPFSEHFAVGMWYGAAARVGICAVLLVISVGWKWGESKTPAEPQLLRVGRPEDFEVSTRTFGLVLGVVVLGALVVRLPRMTHSFWGDEADAVATYIHGNFRPVKKSDNQGKLYFEQPTWLQTFFSARHGANNHVLYSVCARMCLNTWQKLTKKPDTAYEEWVIRIPSLVAGLGSLVTMALLLRRWGWSLLGLLTVAVMAVHPWHIRYSTEARGYALMLLLFPLLLIALTHALEKGRWRSWLAVALCEFLLMYAWAGIMYALVMLNLAVLFLMLARADRVSLLIRWTTANLLAAMAFISLFLPHVTQIQEAGKRMLWTKGAPMDAIWFHNILVQPFTGIPYHDITPNNPAEISWERLFALSPVITVIGFGIILVSFLIGLIVLWRRSKRVALLVSSVLAATIVCTLHFKFILQDELRAWYLIFSMPMVCLCVALAWLSGSAFCARRMSLLPSLIVQTGVVVILLVFTSASLWPMDASLVTQPEEDYKNAVAMTSGRHETFSPKSTSLVHTVWLWRYSTLYDPRGDIRTRNAADLHTQMDSARQANAELYVVVGYHELAKLMSADMLAILDDTTQFEKTAVFPARESLHTLEVYHLKRP